VGGDKILAESLNIFSEIDTYDLPAEIEEKKCKGS